MDKKNLDELFREKFKAFREVPDEKVWTAIERSLDQKKKNRVIPLWWKLGGVAAVLAIALIALYPFGETGDKNPAVTDTENTHIKGTNQNSSGADTIEDQGNNLPIPEITDDAIVDGSEDGEISNTEQYKKQDAGTPSNEDNKVTYSDTGNNAASTKTKINKDSVNRYPKKTQLTANERSKNSKGFDSDDSTDENSPILKKDNVGLAENRNTEALVATQTDTKKKMDITTTDTTEKNQDGMGVTQQGTRVTSIQEKENLAENEIASEDVDKAADGKKSIFEALEEHPDEEKIAEESGSRWSAGPSVAPVYFNAMGEGSPIDPGFSPNSKSGSTNLSYGLSVAYAINTKLSVRSGLHKAEYGYNTNDVGFSPTLAASSSGRLQNIEYAGGSENLAVNDAFSNSESPNSLASEFSTLSAARDGTVAQSFGYLEVPLELDYALVDRRFGVNLVGGISSLFLLDNSVTLSSGELTTELGEARNLNDMNFSTNIGFGVNYKFTPKIRLNIEPVFKYQLNTFSNTSGDFRPYSIGVYSGLNFRF